MEYCYHIWAGAPNCYLNMMDKVLKWVCRAAKPPLAPSFEPLGHPQNYSCRRPAQYSYMLNDFSVTIPRCYWDVYPESFSPCTARL